MQDATFTNYIDIHGEEVRLDELSEEKKRQIAILLSDRFMEAVGYRRKNA